MSSMRKTCAGVFVNTMAHSVIGSERSSWMRDLGQLETVYLIWIIYEEALAMIGSRKRHHTPWKMHALRTERFSPDSLRPTNSCLMKDIQIAWIHIAIKYAGYPYVKF